METQKSPNSQNNLEKEEWGWRNHTPYEATVTKAVWNWHKIRIQMNGTRYKAQK